MTEQALCNAMRLHGGAVYRLALCRLQNAADAEDVYQDVFLRLLSRRRRTGTVSTPERGFCGPR